MFMKVCLRYKKTSLQEDDMNVVRDFLQFLQSHLPLRSDVTIDMVPKRLDVMTTGLRLPKSKIIVLANGRILIDVLRTLSHEWVHEFQHQKLGVKDFQQTKDIGGPEENMANVLSGILMKKFQVMMPQHQSTLYGEG